MLQIQAEDESCYCNKLSLQWIRVLKHWNTLRLGKIMKQLILRLFRKMIQKNVIHATLMADVQIGLRGKSDYSSEKQVLV